MNKTHQKAVRVIVTSLLCLVMTSCGGSPSHVPPYTGELDVAIKQDGTICFGADFDNLTYIGDNPKDIKEIHKLSITLSDSWEAESGMFDYRLREGELICINEDIDGLEQTSKRPIAHDQYYDLSLRGLTEDGYNYVRLHKRFHYP